MRTSLNILLSLFFLLSIGGPIFAYDVSSISNPLKTRVDKDTDLEEIREIVISQMLQTHVQEQRIDELIKTLNQNGSWSDINYVDVSRTGFQHSQHLRRLVKMSLAYTKPNSSLKNNVELKKKITEAIGYWIQNDFQSDNWWWNQIGTPSALVKVLLIMDHNLSKKQINKVLPIVARASYIYAWGARPSGDRIKIAGIQAKRLLFERKEQQFEKVKDIIENDIEFTTDKGLQFDYSFHHRDDKVNNTLSYGKQYADVFAYWASLLSGTQFAFCERSIHLLVDYYLDGICKMLAFGKFPDPGAKNRGLTRRGALNPYSITTPENLLIATDYRKKELDKIVKIRSDKVEPGLSFSKFFWHSDHFTYQRPAFFTSVRMYSVRNHSMEKPYNEEGLMNHYRGDGTNYISRTGNEYKYLAPVYDWQKIPGATIMQRSKMPPSEDIQKRGLTSFVGAVSDGKMGAVGFHFKSPLDPLQAKKSWFFFDDAYVCLGAGISGDSSLPVFTTVNQCKLKSTVIINSRKSGETVLDEGVHSLDQIRWVWQDSVGYIFPKETKEKVFLSNKPQTGSWYRISHQKSSQKKELSESVFKMWIDHGRHPNGSKYQYIVIPGVSKQKLQKRWENPSFSVLSNDESIQAVKDKALNIIEAVFYRPGKLQISRNVQLKMADPGIIMVKLDEENNVESISVEDPTQHLRNIHLSLTGRWENKNNSFIFDSKWDKDSNESHIIISLPQNVYKGKSVSIHF